MATTLVKLWRRLFPFRCAWCEFTSRTPQGMGKHRKRCAAIARLAAALAAPADGEEGKHG